jgi:hypothetical protein
LILGLPSAPESAGMPSTRAIGRASRSAPGPPKGTRP